MTTTSTTTRTTTRQAPTRATIPYDLDETFSPAIPADQW